MYAVEVEQETDGRWIAEVPELPGVLACGATREEAVGKVEALVRQVLVDKMTAGEMLEQLHRRYPEGFQKGEIVELRSPGKLVDFSGPEFE